MKDFSQQLLLHWHAQELLQLAAGRYRHYLAIHEPEFYERRMARFNLRERGDLYDFWHLVLPPSVTNGFGHDEDPIAYILRHTQLLPRQILRYLNAIVNHNVRENGSRFKMDASVISKMIRENEGVIAREICTAFKATYPSAYRACEATIPNLPYSFAYGALHKVYNQHAKGLGVFDDFEHYRRMMIEIGAVGVVTNETAHYDIGLFEYTEPYKLSVSPDDRLCLHPIFFRTFRTSINKSWKPIYPYGSDPETPDRRVP